MITDEQILIAIKELSERGYPPSVRELGKAVGLRSSSSIQNRLLKLRDQGKIQWEPTQPRTIRVVSHV